MSDSSLHRPFRFLIVFATFVCLSTSSWAQDSSSIPTLIDDYIDERFEATENATRELLLELEKLGVSSPRDIEAAIRAPRAEYPDTSELLGKVSSHDVECYHVDYESKFLLSVPKELPSDQMLPVVFIGHGGNSSMSPERAEATAKMYLQAYQPTKTDGFQPLLVAPVSSRGWGHIGNSLILSSLSKLQRMFPIDPDRIYITGQSMGGHMTYRAALSLPDRWGAVSPHSGGYDYVDKKAIGNLFNVPGYAIWGLREPYGINTDNRTNAAWAKENHLHWKFVEKNGGHTIYQDELPKVARFFADNQRDLYRERVYIRSGGTMKFTRTWQIESWPDHTVYSDTRPLRWNNRHWLEIGPRPDHDQPLSIVAQIVADNRIEITCDQVRDLKVLLHPNMVSFDQPVSIRVNGEELFNDRVEPDPAMMLEHVREFDDRGRVFWASIALSVNTDKDVAMDSAATVPEDANTDHSSIFDGKSLKGWHAMPEDSADDWSVEDGKIVGQGSADRLSYLVWNEDLTDFELLLQYRFPGKGNSGIEVRSQKDLSGKRPFEGYHADLGHNGIGPHILGAWDFHFASRSEPPCPRGTQLVIDPEGKLSSSRIDDAISLDEIHAADWNRVRVIAKGNKFQFYINDKLASEFTDKHPDALTHGKIGLQIHDKGMRVEFKDIQLIR